ncbi:hypothetical protein [Spirosoma sp.]|uniref:hypothetical protein n=1 Tax=Spirosoma sp. TaxID=1899569 RepID=UPI003B3B0724
MNYITTPTIQDVMDKAKIFKDQGLSQDEAIRRAIAAITLLDTQSDTTHTTSGVFWPAPALRLS